MQRLEEMKYLTHLPRYRPYQFTRRNHYNRKPCQHYLNKHNNHLQRFCYSTAIVNAVCLNGSSVNGLAAPCSGRSCQKQEFQLLTPFFLANTSSVLTSV